MLKVIKRIFELLQRFLCQPECDLSRLPYIFKYSSRDLLMIDNIYPPLEDSELLLNAALEEINEDDQVLEVGVGSGFVSSRLIDKCKLVIGTDISPFAVKVAKSEDVEVIRTDIARGIKNKFTLILFNPPNLEVRFGKQKREREQERWIDKAIQGGEHGTDIAVKFLDEIGEWLEENGRIILTVSSSSFSYLEHKIESAGFGCEIVGRIEESLYKLYALKLTRKPCYRDKK